MILELICCDYCGCKNYKTRYRKPDNWLWLNQFEYPVVECLNCGLVYLNPRPTQNSMGLFYPDNYHEQRNSDSFKFRYTIQCEYLSPLTDHNVLDIGCARGDFLAFLKNKYPNISTVGLDYFSTKVDYDFIDFYNLKLPDSNFSSFSFDLITAWAVFEHLHDPGAHFEEVYRILKDRGKFVFLVTNSESLYGKCAYTEDIPRHTFHFSEKTLKNYANKYNFSEVNFFYETRLWDSTGTGTFYYKLMEIFGSSWEKRYLRLDNKIQKLAGIFGKFLDKLIFSFNWESRKNKSGILIAEFIK